MRFANRVTVVTLLGAVMLAGADLSAAPQKAKPGPPPKQQVWEVDFLVGGDHYTGTMTLATAKGVVTGKMLIDLPTRIEGEVQGTRTGETLSLDYAYTMVAENCTGRVQVEAKFPPKAQEASGTAHAVDCHGESTDGTVTFKKPANKTGSDDGF